MTGRPDVLFPGFLGTGNIGNDVSLLVAAEAVRHHRPDLSMGVLALGDSRTDVGGLPVTSVPMGRRTPIARISHTLDRVAVKFSDLIRSGRTVARADHVVVPGAGVLEERLAGGAWGFPWTLASIAATASLFGASVHLVAIGAEDPRDRRLRWLFRTTARLATTRSFRDERSRAVVQQLGVDTSRDPLVPDLAFGRPSPAPAPTPTGRVALGVQLWHGPHGDEHAGHDIHERYLERVASVACGLLDAGLAITFVIGDVADRPVPERVRAAVAAMGRDASAPEDQLCTDFDDLVVTMGRCDVVVASRYHNLIAAVVAGRPVISLGYGPKHADLLRNLARADLAHDIDSIDADLVVNQVLQERALLTETAPTRRRETARRREAVDHHLADLVGAWASGPEMPQPSTVIP